ncbi:DUF2600 family protein, partial [Bacillus mycoides]|uniref:DUF2600 family protein n=1 Tax=Bacillus mycoides TaxID=1405 RepID=UPI003CC7EE7C
MTSFQFSPSPPSTLPIFSLLPYPFHHQLHHEHIPNINQPYFPYLQPLHILLHYFIHQHQHRLPAHLNFSTYYQNQQLILHPINHF